MIPPDFDLVVLVGERLRAPDRGKIAGVRTGQNDQAMSLFYNADFVVLHAGLQNRPHTNSRPN